MKTVLNWLGGYVSVVCFFLFGGNPTNISWLYILLASAVIDIVFGLVEAIRNKTFKYSLLFDGFWRKILMLGTIVIAKFFDDMGIMSDSNIQQITTGFLIGYEFVSILNHAKIGGVSIPTKLWNAIQKMLGVFGDDTEAPDGKKP